MPDVDLDMLVFAMSNNNAELSFYLNPRTGKITADDGFGDGHGFDEDEDEDDLIEIEPSVIDNDDDDMEAFIAQVTDQGLREQLLRAIGGRGAFRRFRDVVFNHPSEVGRQWSPFQDALRKRRAVEWLRESDVYDEARADTAIAALDAEIDDLRRAIAAHGDDS